MKCGKSVIRETFWCCAVKCCLVRTFAFVERFCKTHKNDNTRTLLHHTTCTPPHTLSCAIVSQGDMVLAPKQEIWLTLNGWLLHGQRQSRGTEGPLCVNTHTHAHSHSYGVRKRQNEKERESRARWRMKRDIDLKRLTLRLNVKSTFAVAGQKEVPSRWEG